MKSKNFFYSLLLLLSILIFSCNPKTEIPQESQPWPDDINTSLLAKQRLDRINHAKPSKLKIAFLGNSITEMGGDWNVRLGRSDVLNCGQGGYTTQQFSWLLDSALFASSPEYCFIMGGINDLSLGVPVDRVFKNFKFLISGIHEKGIEVIVESTLLQSNNSSNNPDVRKLNSLLRNYCRQYRIPFIDLNKKMSVKSGLMEDLTTDGTHLNEKGYEVWSGILKKWMDNNI
jgi:alpha-glucosidase